MKRGVQMWESLSEPWRESFNQAWKSYSKGSFPIGAVIYDESGMFVSKGRNKVYESEPQTGQICENKIAHAEINAILRMDNFETNPYIKTYTLYSTMEPCPLCFGAIVMSSIRHVKYAAKDGVAGSTDLIIGNDYIRSKNMKIDGPHRDLEIVQFVLKTDFTIRRGYAVDRLLTAWEKDCPLGVNIGRKWYEQNKLQDALTLNKSFGSIFDEILQEADCMEM
jgi:tRNA(adenine34) deaminase